MTCKSIILIGSGGLGKEVCSYLQYDLTTRILADFQIKGVLDDNKENYDASGINIPYLGKIRDFSFTRSDYIVVSIGNIRIRNTIIDFILSRKINFFSYIHPTSIIASDAEIGCGSLIGPYCIVNAQAVIRDHCILNTYSSVGHDSVLGERAVLSPYCTLNGDVQAGKNLFMGTRASLLPGTIIGEHCMVAAHTSVNGHHGDRLLFKQQASVQIVPNRFY